MIIFSEEINRNKNRNYNQNQNQISNQNQGAIRNVNVIDVIILFNIFYIASHHTVLISRHKNKSEKESRWNSQ